MPDVLEPLRHHAYALGDDDVLAREAAQQLAKLPQLQLVGELWCELRGLGCPWWAPELLRAWWPAAQRMRWLTQRADLRQRITTALTGLAPNAARKRGPTFQAELIDAVVDEGDVSAAQFEQAFNPFDLVVYGPVGDVWRAFRASLPLEGSGAALERLTAWLLRALLADRSSGYEHLKRRPILSPWDLRTAIEGDVWHTRMPLELRVAIDEARFRQEKMRPGRAFGARHDLAIAVPDQIAAHIPLVDLVGVLERAERAMGFEPAAQQELLPRESDTRALASWPTTAAGTRATTAAAAATTASEAPRSNWTAEEVA
ncbi:MAG: hypothetical protein AAF715_03720 [Myxococcota bacterium]